MYYCLLAHNAEANLYLSTYANQLLALPKESRLGMSLGNSFSLFFSFHSFFLLLSSFVRGYCAKFMAMQATPSSLPVQLRTRCMIPSCCQQTFLLDIN
jgi:hypothetical protein